MFSLSIICFVSKTDVIFVFIFAFTFHKYIEKSQIHHKSLTWLQRQTPTNNFCVDIWFPFHKLVFKRIHNLGMELIILARYIFIGSF